MHFSKKEIFSIPNLMGYFRILMILVFAYLYLGAETLTEYRVAALVLAIASVTDLFDGMIARKFHMITELGKFIDPAADKLTHLVVLLCLTTRHPQLWILVVLVAVKEGFMLVMGWIKLKKGKKLDGAMWFGKVCTAVLFVVLVAMIVFPFLSEVWINGLTAFCEVLILATLGLYIPVFLRM